jgi:hypothetical protein
MRLSQYMFLIVLFTIIIALLLRPRPTLRERCIFKYLRDPIFKEVRIDCETGEVTFCPRWCPKFNMLKQKCVQETVILDNPEKVCPPGSFGNVRHPFDCNSFFMCANGNPIWLRCSDGFCFNAEQRTCVPKSTGDCTAPCPKYCQNCCITSPL